MAGSSASLTRSEGREGPVCYRTIPEICEKWAWKSDSEYPGGSTWFQDVWRSLERPPLDSDGEIFTQLDGSITSVAMSVNISQLADRQQIIDFSSKTKELMFSKLDF